MPTSDELTSKAKEHRRLGRIEEAMISARHAAALDPKNVDAVWQLALCQIDLYGAAKAIEALETATELAPHFAYGWTQLGLAYSKTGDSDRAKECFEQAVELDADDKRALNELAQTYEQEQRADDEMRVLLALENLSDLTIHQTNRLGILHHNKRDFYTAIQYYRQVVADGSGPSGFFNIGLVFNEPEVGRRADAIDSWRRALDGDPGYDRASKMIARLLPDLSELRQKVTVSGHRILGEDNWYSHYVNPLELLAIDEDVEVDEIDAKFLQRAKKALLQEIELEDGRVEWMQGLSIDRSRAISVCEELSNEDRLGYHYHVFQTKLLSDFLQRGDLKHFLVDESASPLESIVLREEDPDGFGAWLSPLFAAQFDLALTKAIERQDLAAVKCLLDGRRWVQPEDEDKCFDGAHRQVSRLLDPLRKAADESEKVRPTLASVQSVLSNGRADEILGLLPLAFHSEKQEAATLVRSMSIDAHNHHDDADVAKAILQLAFAFTTTSPSLQQRLNDDAKALDERIAAARKEEAHLRFGDAACSITREGVRFGQSFISADDVKTLRWGTVVTQSGAVRSFAFKMVVGGPRDSQVKIEWTATKNLDTQRNQFGKLVNAALTYLMPRIFASIKERLDNNQRLQIGNLVLTKSGVEFAVQGWFTSKTVVCPWSRLVSSLENGEVQVSDAENRKATTRLAMYEIDNAFVVHLLAQGT